MFRMQSRIRPALALLCVLAVVASAREVRGAILRRHTHLVKSEPAANDTLATSPRTFKLWFSEPVELPVTTLKLTGPAGAMIPLAPLARPDTAADAPIVAAPRRPLDAGAYVLTWSTAAKDGHPAKGSIHFVVKAAR